MASFTSPDVIMSEWQEMYAKKQPPLRQCFCIGPQNGDPVCPCRMPDYTQRAAERAAWEREQAAIAKTLKRRKRRKRSA